MSNLSKYRGGPKNSRKVNNLFFSDIVFQIEVQRILQLKRQQKMTEEANQKSPPDFKDVEDGPLSPANRQCRDVICCVLFIVNVVGIAYCAFYGFMNGNPDSVYRATSSTGDVCGGLGTTTELLPYTYFHNPTASDYTTRVCVMACPGFVNGVLQPLTCKAGLSCAYAITINSDGTVNSVDLTAVGAASVSNVTFLGYETQAFMGRICIPSTVVLENALSAATAALSSTVNQGSIANFMTDVQNNWHMLLAGLGISVVLSFVFMFLLRCIAGILVWGSIFAIFFMLIALGIMFLYNGGVITTVVDSVGTFGIPILASDNGYYAYYGYTCFGVAGVLLILLLCCCNRIRLAIAICNCAGQFISRVCQIMFVPIFQAVLIACFWAFALVVMVYLISSTIFVVNGNDIFTAITDYTQVSLLSWYYFVFATLWTNALLQAMITFVIASSCCMWYYTRGPGQDLDSPVLTSYWMIFRFHFGSLAFGSFILAVVQFMQFLVEIFKKQAEANGADQNPIFEYVISCLRCCLACVERIVQFINKTAYIQIALTGKNFCMAAKDGFQIVWANGIRYMIVGGVGEIIMFIGKLLIATGSAFLFYVMITFIPQIKQNIIEPLFLMLIVFIIAFAIGMVFMSVYSVAMDTLLACFIVDETNQKAKGLPAPQYAPEELANLMDVE